MSSITDDSFSVVDEEDTNVRGSLSDNLIGGDSGAPKATGQKLSKGQQRSFHAGPERRPVRTTSASSVEYDWSTGRTRSVSVDDAKSPGSRAGDVRRAHKGAGGASLRRSSKLIGAEREREHEKERERRQTGASTRRTNTKWMADTAF